MKKALLFFSACAFVAVVWHCSQSSLDPVLLRRAIQEYATRREQTGNRRYVTIVDYRKSIAQKRLFVYDVQKHSVVWSSRVAHSFWSGLLYPTKFSNVEGSELSSVGTFLTDKDTYTGRFGAALRVEGITTGVNTAARRRAIVFHADPFPVFCNSLVFNYSLGCFMTSKAVNARLISMIKGRSLVVVYK